MFQLQTLLINVDGVKYRVNWDAFTNGRSVFIPCLKCAQLKKDVKQLARKLRYKIVMKVLVQDNVRGLRIWRT